MRGKITKHAVDAVRPASRDIFLWDTTLKGFGAKCTPAGRKVYLLQFRLGGRGAPTVRSTIGAQARPGPRRRRARKRSGSTASSPRASIRAKRERRRNGTR